MNQFNLNSEYFFQISPDLLCIAGFDGYFKRVNPAVLQLLGYTEEELLSSPIVTFVHPDDRGITGEMQKSIGSGNPLHNFENRYVTKDGELIWLAWTAMPKPSDQLIFAIAKNVTHKKKIEEERNKLLLNLTEINQHLKDLAYTTSHDLRSPVSNIFALISFFEDEKIENARQLEIIGHLKKTATKLEHALEKHLSNLKQREKQSIEIEELLLQEIFDSVKESINSLIQGSQAEFHIDFSEFDKLAFNRDFLESIFLNLITNSIKYAKPNCPPKIGIASKLEAGVQRLIFTDNGIGFDKDKVKDRIFGLSQKFHDSCDTKSQGVGLYLVHTHMTALGGHISVESKINEGTEFTLSFRAQ